MVKTCSKCGSNNRDDAAFCSHCGTSLTEVQIPTAAPTPTVKPVPGMGITPSMPSMGAPMRVPPPGMCYYHATLPAIYVCNRCGRPICRDCSKAYGDLILCPQCYTAVPPPTPPPPIFLPPPPPQPTRPMWGFLLSLVAAILIIINAAALLSNGFYNTLNGILPWIAFFGAFPPWTLVAIGLILGVIIAVGSVLMILGYGTIGSVVVFPAAVISLILGGGLIAGFIIGIVGGILGMLGR